jgi:membrane protease YdiL (CAAX protease family)
MRNLKGGPSGTVLKRQSVAAQRKRSLHRAMCFLALALASSIGGLFLLSRALSGHLDMDHPSIGLNLAGNVLLAMLGVILPALLISRVTREQASLFGWGTQARGRHLAIGLIGGLGTMVLLIAVLGLLGMARFNASPLPVGEIAAYGFAYAAIFALTALAEEGMLRGYVLIQLSRALGFWPAAIITSAIFAALHLVHGNETALGLVQVGIFGLVMAISVARTGALWFALGFHAAWDFTETFLFGVADSGMTGAASLLITRLEGPVWLTGGSVGPEGSLLVLPLLLLTAVAIGVGSWRGGQA